jgi:hypothetical protein
MVDFFTLSDGTDTSNTTEFENGGGQTLIPEGTTLKTRVTEVEWLEATDYCEKCLAVMLSVVEDGEYKDIAVRHKLRVMHPDDSKADKAKQMLGVYNTASKGKLAQVLASKNAYNNQALTRALAGTPIIATFDVYETDSGSKGNWVRKVVAPAAKGIEQQAARAEADRVQQTAPAPVEDDFAGDDIPF